ncbi:MAG: class I SAM-dependent methyltransferase [Fervidobacterium sp.]|uniref:class I SAM-dependent methyltransferase n=1 Tax=Fervidobacterium sp. TaxID=1871331 RepID=UPI004049DF81
MEQAHKEISHAAEKSEGIVITTSHNASNKAVELAKELSAKFNIPYYNRRHISDRLKDGTLKLYYVVDSNKNLSVVINGQKLFFHPGISKIRMENYKREGRDFLLEALRPESTDVVYDGTFGLGMDAVFIANFVSQVIGTEVSEHIYRVVSYGMANYKSKEEWINKALKKIVLFNENMKEFVKKQPDRSYDIVYCDPMFENPVFESSALNPLRPLASYDTIDRATVNELIRISKKRVVIKTLAKDGLLERLNEDGINFDRVIMSKKNGLIFACIDLV